MVRRSDLLTRRTRRPLWLHRADKFSDGLAHVRFINKHALIDHSGKLVVPLQFDEASSFLEGIAEVRLGENRYEKTRLIERQKIGYIDNTGKYIWKPTN